MCFLVDEILATAQRSLDCQRCNLFNDLTRNPKGCFGWNMVLVVWMETGPRTNNFQVLNYYEMAIFQQTSPIQAAAKLHPCFTTSRITQKLPNHFILKGQHSPWFPKYKISEFSWLVLTKCCALQSAFLVVISLG